MMRKRGKAVPSTTDDVDVVDGNEGGGANAVASDDAPVVVVLSQSVAFPLRPVTTPRVSSGAKKTNTLARNATCRC